MKKLKNKQMKFKNNKNNKILKLKKMNNKQSKLNQMKRLNMIQFIKRVKIKFKINIQIIIQKALTCNINNKIKLEINKFLTKI